MGNCCSGRPEKVKLSLPVLSKPGKKRHERRVSIPPLLPAVPQPQSLLQNIANLGHRARSQVDSILSPNKVSHKEYGEEKLAGYVKVVQVLRSMERVGRLLVFSNYAMYFLEQLDYALEGSCDMLNILLITLSPDHCSAILHQSLEHNGDVWVETLGVGELLGVIETNYCNKRNKYVPCTTAQSGDEMSELFNRRSPENLISYHSPEYEEITRVIYQNGKLGENRVFFRKTQSCSSNYPVLEDSFILVTTLSIYILKADYTVKDKINLVDVWDVTVADDDSCQMFTSVDKSYLCYLDKGFRRLMEEILQAKQEKLRIRRRTDIEGRFRKAYHPD